jgi:MFS-type transporter involved in bile tolerance (Atg22 family)
MEKKLMSTVALFAVFIGFLLWGGSLLVSSITSHTGDKENIVYSLLLLGCAGYALVSILMLPRKNQS